MFTPVRQFAAMIGGDVQIMAGVCRDGARQGQRCGHQELLGNFHRHAVSNLRPAQHEVAEGRQGKKFAITASLALRISHPLGVAQAGVDPKE